MMGLIGWAWKRREVWSGLVLITEGLTNIQPIGLHMGVETVES